MDVRLVFVAIPDGLLAYRPPIGLIICDEGMHSMGIPWGTTIDLLMRCRTQAEIRKQ